MCATVRRVCVHFPSFLCLSLSLVLSISLSLLCFGSDRPDGQAVHPSLSEVAQGFGLIPVNSARETVGVGSEVASEEKMGGNGVEGTFNKDMTNDGMIFETHKQIVKPLSQVCDHIWRARQEKVRVCAYGEVFSVRLPSRSWQLPLSGRETASKNKV